MDGVLALFKERRGNYGHGRPYGYTIEDLRAAAAKAGAKCLSTEYRGIRVDYLWRCAAGHEAWRKAPPVLEKGFRCFDCPREKPPRSERAKRPAEYSRTRGLMEERMRKLAAERSGQCLSPTYLGQDERHEWRCVWGHTWQYTWRQVRAGSWCPECSGAAGSLGERICREVLEAMFRRPFPKVRPDWLRNTTGKCLELDGFAADLSLAFEYHGEQHYEAKCMIGSKRREARFQAQCERDELKLAICRKRGVTVIVIPAFTDALNPSGCMDQIEHAVLWAGVKIPRRWRRPSEIGAIYRPLSAIIGEARHESLSTLARSRGGALLSEVGARPSDDLRWVCAEDHAWSAPASAIEAGGWCRECWTKAQRDAQGTLEGMRSLAVSYGGECLSDEYQGRRVPLEWRCGANHTWWRQPRYVIAGKWCPTCRLDAHNDAQRLAARQRADLDCAT